MKKLILSLFLLCMCHSVGAQNEPAPLKIDLGAISRDQTYTATVELNTRQENVVSLCECVEASVEKTSQGRFILTIQFDPHEYWGPTIQELLLVDTNGGIRRVEIHALVQ